MFKFLKDKIKSVISSFTKKAEQAAEVPEELAAEKVSTKNFEKPAGKQAAKTEERRAAKPAQQKKPAKRISAEKIEEIITHIEVPQEKVYPEEQHVRMPAEQAAVPEPRIKAPELQSPANVAETAPAKVEAEKPGFFSRIAQAFTTTRIDKTAFDSLFWEMEVALMENNVALEVVEKIKADLKAALVDKPLPKGKVEGMIRDALRKSIEDLLAIEPVNLLERAATKKPFVIVFVGVNGSGKTTTIAKVANLFMKNNKSVVIAASDTFRAAAIDQLEQHANKLGVKLIKHDYGSDPAAVAFDAVKHAQARNVDVVLVDTAGRLHSNVNLVDEMKKIVRVAKPDMIIFIGESITGNDCVEQAAQFDKAVGIDGIILAKADVDEKGGAALSVSYITKKPILYLGVGQGYSDIEPFDKAKVIASLGI